MHNRFVWALLLASMLAGCVTDSTPKVEGHPVSAQEEANDRAACRSEIAAKMAANEPPPLQNGEYDLFKNIASSQRHRQDIAEESEADCMQRHGYVPQPTVRKGLFNYLEGR